MIYFLIIAVFKIVFVLLSEKWIVFLSLYLVFLHALTI